MAVGDDTLEFIPTLPIEKMSLMVNDVVYSRWTSARVTLQIDSPFQEFQFSVSEPIDIFFDADNWHIHVGDAVRVYVGGWLVIDGFIDVREAFYDANQHGVMFYGRCYNSNAYESSVRMEGGEVQLQNATFTQIMDRALQGSGTAINAPDDNGTIFPNWTISFGETPWNVGERIKRYIPALRITAEPRGRVWEARASYLGSGGATFIEGNNILSARATIDARQRMAEVHTKGQRPNRDERPGGDHNVEGRAIDGTLSRTQLPRYTAIPIEDPASDKMAQGRAEHELVQRVEDIIHCQIKVYSWFENASGDDPSSWRLYWMYRQYIVSSPMLQMASSPLWSRQVVFEQSEAGSTTTLELASKHALFPYFAHRAPQQLGDPGPSSNIGGQGVPLSDVEQLFAPPE
jgi:prophage tail gpP-like protein